MGTRRSGPERISFVLNLFMIIAYAMGGVVIYIWHLPSIPDQNRKILSGVLLLYSFFRLFKLLRAKKTGE